MKAPRILTLALITSLAAVCLPSVQAQFTPAVSYPTGPQPYFPDVGDFNADGNIDIVVGSRDTKTIDVLLGNGDGTFQAPVNSPSGAVAVGATVEKVVTSDFNGDSIPDVAVANSDNLALWSGNGDGTFSLLNNYPGTFAGVAVGDVNGDAIPDLVTAENGNSIGIRVGLGVGIFAPVTLYPAGTNPTRIKIADLSGDGIPDLAVVNNDSDNMSVYMGVGGGVFLPQILYVTGVKPAAVDAGDLDGDGDLDLAVGNATDTIFSVFLNLGGGVFAPQSTYNFLGNSFTSILRDFNVDGKLDLLGSSSIAGHIILFGGLGDGTFSSGSPYLFPGNPVGGLSADFDGDTIPDVAVGDYSGGNMVVYLNRGQRIDFPAIPPQQLKDGSVLANATATSGLPVTYSIVSGPATVNGNQITFQGPGQVVVRASQAGLAPRLPAFPVDVTFNIDPGPSSGILFKVTPDGRNSPQRLAFYDSAGRYTAAASFTRLKGGKTGGVKTLTISAGIDGSGAEIYFNARGLPDRVFTTGGYSLRFFRATAGSARVVGIGPKRQVVSKRVPNYLGKYRAELGPLNYALADFRSRDFSDPATAASGLGRDSIARVIAGLGGVGGVALEVAGIAVAPPEAQVLATSSRTMRYAQNLANVSLTNPAFCRLINAGDGLDSTLTYGVITTAIRGENYRGTSLRRWFNTKRQHFVTAFTAGYVLNAFYVDKFGQPAPIQ